MHKAETLQDIRMEFFKARRLRSGDFACERWAVI